MFVKDKTIYLECLQTVLRYTYWYNMTSGKWLFLQETLTPTKISLHNNSFLVYKLLKFKALKKWATCKMQHRGVVLP